MAELTPKTLTTTQTITNVVDKVVITANVHNDEQGNMEHHYMTLLTDGTPFQRGAVRYDTPEEIDVFWGKVQAEITGGATARDAMNTVATADVFAKIEGA